jgi:hypothetical protein
MARSLTVSTEENPRANWLLTGFLLVAIAFLALGAIATMAMFDEADAAAIEAR